MKKSTEHKDSILATHPELDGTGLEYWSYATLHFNSRRTGQSVFMIRQWRVAEKNNTAFEVIQILVFILMIKYVCQITFFVNLGLSFEYHFFTDFYDYDL